MPGTFRRAPEGSTNVRDTMLSLIDGIFVSFATTDELMARATTSRVVLEETWRTDEDNMVTKVNSCSRSSTTTANGNWS